MAFDKDYIVKNKNEALKSIENYLNECILSDTKHQKKANLISFWLKDYINYLSSEEKFNSANLKHYNRGDVIKANLGFNVGNEEGGLHYCIVLDKINAKSYSTLTVVPLSSLKPKSKIRDTQVYLGHELFDKLHTKYTSLRDRSLDRAIEVQKKLEDYEHNNVPFRATPEDFKAMQDANLCFKVGTEIVQMKTGTIALVNQITTISKQRIYDPKNDLGILSDVRISDKYLDLIDKKIQKLFLKN